MSILVLSQGWLKPERGVVLGLGNDDYVFRELYDDYGLWELCIITLLLLLSFILFSMKF